jgi:hypothetical protein
MSATDKLQALKQKGFGAFATPPKPEDAPQNLRKAEVIPEEGAKPAPVAEPVSPLHQAAAGDLSPANDKPKAEKPRDVVAPKVERGKVATARPRGAMPAGHVQINGRVPEEVRLEIAIASKVHKKEVGEIIAEAFALWKKKHQTPNV